MKLLKDYEHGLTKRKSQELAEVYYVEISSNLYYIEKDRVTNRDGDYVNSDIVISALKCLDNVAIESLNGLLTTFTESSILSHQSDERW